MLNKSPRDLEKLAGLGALGAAAGIMAAWLGLVWILRPVSSGGIDGTSHFAVAAASFVPMAWLAVAHAWFGIQLKRGADSIRG
jgi:hypothetical protein